MPGTMGDVPDLACGRREARHALGVGEDTVDGL